jgi:Fe-S-cluster-containing dehydrogenase component
MRPGKAKPKPLRTTDTMSHNPQNEVSPKTIEQVYKPMNRRTFLKGAAASMVGVAGLMAALKPLLELESGAITLDDLLQKHYRELKPEDLKRIMDSLAAKAEQEYGVRPNLRDLKPLDGVEFGYALNLSRCVGCRKCAHACLKENNQSRDDANDIENSYIRVLEMNKGAINLETSTVYYDPETVPQKDKYYMPVQCHQCRQSPCTKVCPVQATWQEKDGVVVVDYNWCIGCRYCMAACPYDARRLTTRSRRSQKKRSIRTRAISATASARKAWWRNARSACTARATGNIPRASKSVPLARAYLATCSIRTARSTTS